MKISEQDLFKFIFYPDSLPQNTFSFITNNKQKFSNELEFLENLNSEMKNEITQNVLDKLYKRIERLNNSVTIILEPEISNHKLNKSEYCLAAASARQNEQLRCETFRDKENLYLLKIFYGKTENKIYLFAKHEIQNKNIEFTFIPSNKKLNLNSNELPVSFGDNETVSQIQLNISN
ncbi:MAG: hypothetical protein IPM32_12400 [Ignavibacteriae bacterium]|nr:hypothetical protein [Ignavibacteriota bacterium]